MRNLKLRQGTCNYYDQGKCPEPCDYCADLGHSFVEDKPPSLWRAIIDVALIIVYGLTMAGLGALFGAWIR